ncbi:MAG: hypothetical protein BWK73_33840 [Thiothrix lacustris]|uniref:Outer membrane protein beta-barrel domain-containing protein n=1 Tax=Thiothrix lacustris TaxID=525917 RepID=A0A1Y1QHD3_9GAMM|nr:MAG: hypothetical protein BWK73_33840 [Thiothrix lacustris]
MLCRNDLLRFYGICLGISGLPALSVAEGILPDATGIQATYTVDSGEGLGAAVAWDVGERWRLRASAEHFSGQQEHLISLIRFTEDRERTDVGVFVERKLAGDSGWYASVGVLHPNHGTRWDALPATRAAYTLNGRQYAGSHLSEPEGRVDYANLVPYVGLGWQTPQRSGWQVGAELGVLAGLDPTFSIHTDNPYQLPYLEQDLQAEADKYLATTQAETPLAGEQALKASISLRYSF